MEMKCPYCDLVGGLTATHRHMVEAHLEMVTTEREAETNRMQYTVACPFCEDMYQRQVKPRSRNPRFLDEFKAEIALVAFDQMLYHILEKHSGQVGVDPAELGLESN
jgi:hypothetical protein